MTKLTVAVRSFADAPSYIETQQFRKVKKKALTGEEPQNCLCCHDATVKFGARNRQFMLTLYLLNEM
jgi:hypothetical protein